jgi:hypothetical protein
MPARRFPPPWSVEEPVNSHRRFLSCRCMNFAKAIKVENK